MTTTTYAATLDDIRDAAERIRPYAHRTPVLTCSTLDGMCGIDGVKLHFKCEPFQKVGAFKFRGACNAIMKLPDDQAQRGVVTHSSGNHAQAIALAAKLRGIPAHIVMPDNASAIKKEAVRGYGGRIVECEPNTESRHGTADRVAQQTGAVLIPPYDHRDIIAGQGTAALELLEVVPELDAIIAPIGGGGLMSGTCIASKGIMPDITMVGGEPSGADDAARSLAAGDLIPMEHPNTICDGLLTSMGELTWPIIRDHVSSIITATDERVIEMMRLVLTRMKMVIEPSAAVAVAAAMSDEFRALSEQRGGFGQVGIILSGGNVDPDRLPWRTVSPG